jgi:two-component system chemotaxis sensor kinase CheA
MRFRSEIAKDGLEGIKKFDENQFDLVTTDIRMNTPDGHDVLRHKRNSHRKLTPTVSISATPWDLEKSEFDSVLAKPFSIQAVIDTVNSLTGGPLVREKNII